MYKKSFKTDIFFLKINEKQNLSKFKTLIKSDKNRNTLIKSTNSRKTKLYSVMSFLKRN